MPAVTVLLPVYNARPHLRLAVESILHQTFTDIELIALDDASTDGSADDLRSFTDPRLKIVTRPKSGYAANLNHGLGLAAAPLIARMDADDVSHPQRLQLQHLAMAADPALVACGCSIRFIDVDGKPTGTHRYYETDDRIRWNLLFDSAFAHPGTMLRKSAIEAAGGYDANQEPAEDYALWLRLAKHGTLANRPEVLLDYRVHPGSVSHQRTERQRSLAQQISVTHLLEEGYAQDESEADAFRAVARGEPGDIGAFLRVAKRFLARYPAAKGIVRRNLIGAAKRSKSLKTLARAVLFQ